MTGAYLAPRPLTPPDELEGFTCASTEQTTWLRRHARQSMATGTTRVFVVTRRRRPEVVAFYAWCLAQLVPGEAPARLRRGAGRYPQPVALLARLGVDERHEGRGLGSGLLADAIARLVGIGDDIGCRACSSTQRRRAPATSTSTWSRGSR